MTTTKTHTRATKTLPFECTYRFSFFLLMLLFLNNSPYSKAEETLPSLEYQIKASLVFNFLKFIEWPSEEEQMAKSIRLCVVGPDRFGAALTQLQTENIRSRPLTITFLLPDSLPDPLQCDVIFISATPVIDTDRILSKTTGQSVLTVGESPDFLQHGGIITILVEGDRVVFDISRAAARRAQLKLSSRLLRVARNVHDD